MVDRPVLIAASHDNDFQLKLVPIDEFKAEFNLRNFEPVDTMLGITRSRLRCIFKSPENNWKMFIHPEMWHTDDLSGISEDVSFDITLKRVSHEVMEQQKISWQDSSLGCWVKACHLRFTNNSIPTVYITIPIHEVLFDQIHDNIIDEHPYYSPNLNGIDFKTFETRYYLEKSCHLSVTLYLKNINGAFLGVIQKPEENKTQEGVFFLRDEEPSAYISNLDSHQHQDELTNYFVNEDEQVPFKLRYNLHQVQSLYDIK